MTYININKIIRTDKQFLVSNVVVVIAAVAILTIGLTATTGPTRYTSPAAAMRIPY